MMDSNKCEWLDVESSSYLKGMVFHIILHVYVYYVWEHAKRFTDEKRKKPIVDL